MALGYAWERFFMAVNSLVSNGALNERLAGAALNLNNLKPADFLGEDELQQRFSDLMQNLEGFQSDNVPNISADDGEKLAGEIFRIFNDIALRDPNHHHHIASDIDLVRHFATQPTPEKPKSVHNLRKLTYEELRKLRDLRVQMDEILVKAEIPEDANPLKKGLRKLLAKVLALAKKLRA
jgi:hypothetical protein